MIRKVVVQVIFVVYSARIYSKGELFQQTPSWACRTLQTLSLREKIAQLCVVAISFPDTSNEMLASSAMTMKNPLMHRAYIEHLIQAYGIGGIIFLRKSTISKQAQLTNQLQRLSKIPLLVAQDLEWGLAMRLEDGIKFPRNLTLGALRNENLVYALGKEIGRECKLLGVHMNLAPVVDINTNPANPVINDRSFGQSKEKVARLGVLYMKGLQDAGIMACAKHFPGHGDTALDSHVTAPRLHHSKKRLNAVELYPFKHLIAQGVDAIMNAHLHVLSCDTKLSTLSHSLVTDLLQKKLGFRGLILTDALNMGAVASYNAGELALKAFLAGNDLLVVPVDVPQTIEAIEQAVEQGKICETEIDRRVLKILHAKEYVGLPKKRFVSSKNAMRDINIPLAQRLKARLYQEAITTHQAKNGGIPLAEHAKPAVIQIGGKKNGKFMQTLCAAHECRKYYLPANMQTVQSQQYAQKITLNGRMKERVIVAIYDMNKYANKQYGISAGTRELLKQLRQRGNKITIVIFGSPYSVKLLSSKDTVVVAYEDDPDAEKAAARVLLGIQSATGTLPVS